MNQSIDHTASISINDRKLNIQIGLHTMLMVETPGGTKATIMPLSSKAPNKFGFKKNILKMEALGELNFRSEKQSVKISKKPFESME